jgi:dienelactone hydrolase
VLSLAIAALAAQLTIEGYRWQLTPIYLVTGGLAVGDLLSMERVLPWWRRISRPLLGLIGLGMLILLPVMLPVPVLPGPTGSLGVGTMTFEVSFPERLEMYGPNPETEPRRIAVQVWYPAVIKDGTTRAPWTPDLDLLGPVLSRRAGYPGFFLSHTRYTFANARAGAEPLPGRFPVVLYSHGWAEFRSLALYQVESLASHGYIVVAPDHSFVALASRMPGGEIIALDPEALPAPQTTDPETYAGAAVDLVETLTADLAGLLDALNAGLTFGAIDDHVDLGRVGVFGHGAGGGAAVRLCLTDPRCRAGLGQDPWVEPVPDGLIAQSAQVPLLFMRSDEGRATANDGRLRGLAERSDSTTFWIGIEGADSSDFLLTPLLSPIAHRLGLKGPIPAGSIVPIIDRFLVGFFDHTLLGTGPAAVETNPFPEVSLEVIG